MPHRATLRAGWCAARSSLRYRPDCDNIEDRSRVSEEARPFLWRNTLQYKVLYMGQFT